MHNGGDLPHPARACGPHLSSLVSSVCRYIGYREQSKRSQDQNLGSSYFQQPRYILDGSEVDGTDLRVPERATGVGVFLPKASALSFLHDKRNDGGITRGIFCECCVHQCSIGEIGQYCNQQS